MSSLAPDQARPAPPAAVDWSRPIRRRALTATVQGCLMSQLDQRDPAPPRQAGSPPLSADHCTLIAVGPLHANPSFELAGVCWVSASDLSAARLRFLSESLILAQDKRWRRA
jgi:hypothetical protein